MSDFGTILIIGKEDESAFLLDELNTATEKLKTIIKDLDLEDAAGELFRHELTIEDAYGEYPPHLLVRLSEHYWGDEDDVEETKEFVEDIELDLVDELITEMKSVFPNYKFKKLVTEW